VTRVERVDWRTRPPAVSPTRQSCVDYVPVVPEPTPAQPQHNGLAGIVRRQSRRPAARMRRSTGPLYIGPGGGCPLAIGSCGWRCWCRRPADRRSFDTAQPWAAACRTDWWVGSCSLLLPACCMFRRHCTEHSTRAGVIYTRTGSA